MSLESKTSVPRVLTPYPAIQKWSFTTDTDVDSCSSTEEIGEKEENPKTPSTPSTPSTNATTELPDESDESDTTETQILESDVWDDASCVDVSDRNIIHSRPTLGYVMAVGYIGIGIIILYSVYNGQPFL